MIPLIMNNKNKCREEINRSTSDITGRCGKGPQTHKGRGRRGRGQWDGVCGDPQPLPCAAWGVAQALAPPLWYDCFAIHNG